MARDSWARALGFLAAEPRATTNEQRTTSNEPRAASREPRIAMSALFLFGNRSSISEALCWTPHSPAGGVRCSGTLSLAAISLAALSGLNLLQFMAWAIFVVTYPLVLPIVAAVLFQRNQPPVIVEWIRPPRQAGLLPRSRLPNLDNRILWLILILWLVLTWDNTVTFVRVASVLLAGLVFLSSVWGCFEVGVGPPPRPALWRPALAVVMAGTATYALSRFMKSQSTARRSGPAMGCVGGRLATRTHVCMLRSLRLRASQARPPAEETGHCHCPVGSSLSCGSVTRHTIETTRPNGLAKLATGWHAIAESNGMNVRVPSLSSDENESPRY